MLELMVPPVKVKLPAFVVPDVVVKPLAMDREPAETVTFFWIREPTEEEPEESVVDPIVPEILKMLLVPERERLPVLDILTFSIPLIEDVPEEFREKLWVEETAFWRLESERLIIAEEFPTEIRVVFPVKSILVKLRVAALSRTKPV